MAWRIQSPEALRSVLAGVGTIAVVGLSADPSRPSHDVCAFLVRRGYRCVGVNPRLAGSWIAGAPVVASLDDLDQAVDMIDVFRASGTLPALVEEVLAMRRRPSVLWTQLGVIDKGAGAAAAHAGLRVVMNACPKIVLSSLVLSSLVLSTGLRTLAGVCRLAG